MAPGEHKYLFVYPLTKVREWYGLSKDERQQAMNQHIAVGHTYSSVKLNTTYSFGLDDQEFVLAFETDEPGISSISCRSCAGLFPVPTP